MEAKLPSFSQLTGTELRVKAVDIGASLGEAPPYAPLLSSGVADLVGFEPDPAALAELNKVKSERESYLPLVIGDGSRQKLHVCRFSPMTSLLEPDPTFLSLFHALLESSQQTSVEEVDTVRLDDVTETQGMEFLKIDIQGAELMVFQNAVERLRTTLVIHTEVEFLPLYKDQPLFADVDTFLRKQGFMLHKIHGVGSRVVKPLLINNDVNAGLSQWVWADAIFVRDISRPEALSDEQLLKSALILHDCYMSVDLSLFFLTQYDQRNGTTLSQNYLRGLGGEV